jgi:hypothetical protein
MIENSNTKQKAESTCCSSKVSNEMIIYIYMNL